MVKGSPVCTWFSNMHVYIYRLERSEGTNHRASSLVCADISCMSVTLWRCVSHCVCVSVCMCVCVFAGVCAPVCLPVSVHAQARLRAGVCVYHSYSMTGYVLTTR